MLYLYMETLTPQSFTTRAFTAEDEDRTQKWISTVLSGCIQGVVQYLHQQWSPSPPAHAEPIHQTEDHQLSAVQPLATYHLRRY